MNLEVRENALTPDIYIALREKVAFQPYAYDDVVVALHNSTYTVVVYDEDKPIAISRIVGDDRIVFFIKDVVVDPSYQKMKIGKLLMKSMFDYIGRKACQGAYIGLMSTPCCIEFYEKYGFKQRPCDGMGPGMIKFYDKDEVIE